MRWTKLSKNIQKDELGKDRQRHRMNILRRVRRPKQAYAWKRCDIRTGLWSQNLNGGDHLGDLKANCIHDPSPQSISLKSLL
jgi:hypothetical protein